jgi:hypothetical protein
MSSLETKENEIMEPSLCSVVVTSYEGSLDINGCYSEYGIAVMDNDSVYEGYFRNGFFHGKGKFTWPNKVTFSGDFYNGKV